MNANSKLTSLLTAALIMSALSAHAQMDVDQADSLNFEAFHTDKDSAVKLWDDKDKDSKAITKTFTDEKIKTNEQPTKNTAEKTTATTSTSVKDNQGKRFEIRELYSITGSERTGYNPNTVVQALFLQMQGLCPQGWKKLDERSVPDGQEFYLHYQFECL